MPEAPGNGRPARGRLLPALSVVVVGAIFWLRKAQPELGAKVWVLFLLVPFFLFSSIIWGHYQRAGAVTRSMAHWVAAALFLVMIMGVVLTGTPWASTWPAVVVIAGIGGVVRAVAKS